MKIDKFTAVIIGIVLLLLIAAVVTVNLTGNGDAAGETYSLTDDAPGTPVHNAFVALQKGDLFTAREQYSARILDEENGDIRLWPIERNQQTTKPRIPTRRLRILSVEIDDKNPDQALVTFVQDTYRSDGPFGTGSTWSNQRTVEVVREDGVWKLNTPEFFY